jgi:hypothetical protein
VGFLDRLLGRSAPPPAPAAEVDQPPPREVDVVAICRHGMNVPSPDEIDEVVAIAYPEGLGQRARRVGLSQPSWFKTQESAESAAADVAQAMAHKFALGEYEHHHRIIEREGAAKVLLVEVYALHPSRAAESSP